ncbi:hypothetical protein [Algiphilus sp.]|uniref:hypothetical protein n=1 Tax=Algiphilus sp. TaxID=1872431 RepID=UPI0025BE9A4A|nr:hypothetical protein [Algiphilus sp.]MCK5769472.1 hypothetical protein [Algiphilus sp.]
MSLAADFDAADAAEMVAAVGEPCTLSLPGHADAEIHCVEAEAGWRESGDVHEFRGQRVEIDIGIVDLPDGVTVDDLAPSGTIDRTARADEPTLHVSDAHELGHGFVRLICEP